MYSTYMYSMQPYSRYMYIEATIVLETDFVYNCTVHVQCTCSSTYIYMYSVGTYA